MKGYRWDIKEIKKDNKKRDIKNILDMAIDTGVLTTAVQELKDKNIINKDRSLSYYQNLVSKTKRFKNWREQQNKERTIRNNKVLGLLDAGLSHQEISIKLNIVRSLVYEINKNEIEKSKYDDHYTRQSKKIVNHWNKYSLESSVLTKETIKAFEFLGLEVPNK